MENRSGESIIKAKIFKKETIKLELMPKERKRHLKCNIGC